MNQINIFFESIVFGLFLGFIYDLLRVPRLIHKTSSWLIFFQDVFYFFICGIATFLFALVVNYGDLRFFIAAGEIIGWCLYNLTIANVTKIIYKFLLKFIQMIENALKTLALKIFSPIINLTRCKMSKIKIKRSKKLLKSNNHLMYNVFRFFYSRKKSKRSKSIDNKFRKEC